MCWECHGEPPSEGEEDKEPEEEPPPPPPEVELEDGDKGEEDGGKEAHDDDDGEAQQEETTAAPEPQEVPWRIRGRLKKKMANSGPSGTFVEHYFIAQGHSFYGTTPPTTEPDSTSEVDGGPATDGDPAITDAATAAVVVDSGEDLSARALGTSNLRLAETQRGGQSTAHLFYGTL